MDATVKTIGIKHSKWGRALLGYHPSPEAEAELLAMLVPLVVVRAALWLA